MVRAKIVKDTLCGTPSVRVRAKIVKPPFLVGLWLGLRQNYSKNNLCGMPLIRVRAKNSESDPLW